MSENPEPGLELVSQAPKQRRPIGCVPALLLLAAAAVVIAMMLPSVRRTRSSARRSQCKDNLKQIAVALYNYERDYHSLPPAYTVDADGKPLHSWRTLILPYLGMNPLYDTINLSKPWNDPANAEACNIIVPEFHCPANAGPPNHSTYMAIVAPNGCFRPTEPRRFSEITDNLSETLMVIEVPVDRSVHWMSPNDADESLVMGIGLESKLSHLNGMDAAFCDGSIRFLSAGMPADQRRALISIAGGDTAGDF